MGTTARQKKLFFNLRKAKSKISALEEEEEEGLHPDQVKLIAKRLGVTEQDGRDDRRLSGDVSLNAPSREDGSSGERKDWLVDEASDQMSRLAESEEANNSRRAVGVALSALNERERRIFEARRCVLDVLFADEILIFQGGHSSRPTRRSKAATPRSGASQRLRSCGKSIGSTGSASSCVWARAGPSASRQPILSQRGRKVPGQARSLTCDPRNRDGPN
jgi:hypothetical protein